MEKFWRWLAVQSGKHAGWVSIVGLAITLVLGLGITKLEFATGQDSYLNKDEQVYTDNIEYQELFGGQAMLTLITMDEGRTVADLFTEQNSSQIESAIADVSEQPDVLGVIGPTTIAEFSQRLLASESGNPAESIAGKALLTALANAPDEASKAARSEDTATTLARLGEIPESERTLDNKEWVEFLLYDNQGEIRSAVRTFIPDETHAQIVTRLKGNLGLEEEGLAAEQVVERMQQMELDGATTVTTGAPILLKDINDYLRGGILTLGAIAVAIMALILLIFFNVRWRLLPLLVIVIGVIWAFGLAGYLGIPLTVVTIAGLPVMLGVGIDYAIQLHSRVEEEVLIDRDPHPIQETAVNLGPALLVVTFDAIFAFAALRFAKVPMIREFGLLLAVGIAAICLCSIVTPLSILGIREYKSPSKGGDFSEGYLGRFVVKIGSLPAKVAPVLVVAAIVAFVGGAVVEDKLELQTDPVQWVNQDSQVIQDLDVILQETGSRDELGVFVQTDEIFSQPVITWMDEFTNDSLDRHAESLITANSIISTISELLVVPGAEHAVPTVEDVKAAYEVAPPAVQASTVGPDGGSLNVIFRAAGSSLDERAVVVNDISDTVSPPEGVRATPSGLAVVGVGLLENIEANRVLLTYLAVLFVGLFLTVRLRSLVRALLSLVPVLIAVGVSSLVAYVFDLKLSPMTAVGGPLVVAVCTEFTSLILLRFVEERNRGLAPKEAVDVAAGRTGRAFIVSGMTAVSGVFVIATSSLPMLRDFGLIVGMNVLVALFSALVILPPMLVWADQRNWVSKGLVKPENLVGAKPEPEPTLAD